MTENDTQAQIWDRVSQGNALLSHSDSTVLQSEEKPAKAYRHLVWNDKFSMRFVGSAVLLTGR